MLLNKETGEIALDGTQARLIFTAEAWTWIETGTGLSTMEILQRSADAKLSMTQTAMVLVAGIEAHNRRTGRTSTKPNPTRALKLITEGGGLFKVMQQLNEAFEHSQALGLAQFEQDVEEGDDTVDPTTGGDSSADASPPDFALPTPGTSR